jgi:1-acyl-sn-glycerol-3-phosphate acyltransferase
MVNGFHIVFLLPLRIVAWFIPPLRMVYDELIRYTKGSFASLIVLLCQLCAPTEFSFTFETEGPGAFTQQEIADVVVRDERGHIVSLNLPDKSVFISNHQMYADWLYAWVISYLIGAHKDIFIVSKDSLKWVPVVGWGMQFFNFIFLARSWAADRLNLVTKLSLIGQQAEQREKPLMFLLYPEGTVISENTQPVSKKYADKLGIENLKNVLLPRSTGLLYSLRSLAPRIPNLQMLDATIVYPGIPPMGYGQSFYTMRSIFLDRVPPPVIHVHLRKFDVAAQVPIGDLSQAVAGQVPKKDGKSTVESEIPEREREAFDLWLRDLWREKDESMDRFFETGAFAVGQSKVGPLRIPVKLRSWSEVLDAYCLFLPAALVGYLWDR